MKDDSQCAWLVGYFSREYAGGDQIEITYSNPTVDMILEEGQTIQNYVNTKKAYKQGLTELSFDFTNVFGGYTNVQEYHYRATLSNSTNNWTIKSISSDPGVNWRGGGIGSNLTQEDVVQMELNILNNAKPLTILQQTTMYFNNNTEF